MKWRGKCMCGEMNMCIWQCQDTGAMNRSPTPDGVFATHFVVDVGNRRGVRNPFRGGRGELTECFALYFVGVKGTFTKCSQRVRNLFDIHS